MSTDRRAAVGQMIVSMTSAPSSVKDLAFLMGTTEETVSAWIKTFQSFKLAYRSAWLPDARGYLTIPAYSWGQGDDVPSPAKSSTERVREFRKRQKA